MPDDATKKIFLKYNLTAMQLALICSYGYMHNRILESIKEDKALDVSRDGQITEPEFERLMNDEVIGVTVQLCYIYKENSLSSYTEHN